MPAYIVAQIQINDREGYSKYEEGFMAIFTQFKGKMLAVDESPKLLEGSWGYTRTVLVEFPSNEDANAWYYSEQYQMLAQHRFASSSANIVSIQGLETDSAVNENK
ncbi:MAG: DUF1330 domain-containing protein [Oceanicoccus sp.]